MSSHFLKSQQQVWGTIAGSNISELNLDCIELIKYGVEAIEFRADLIPRSVLIEFLKLEFPVPVFIANFNLDQSVLDCFKQCACYCKGFLFHLEHPNKYEIINFCNENEKLFIAAYHSQKPLKRATIINKYSEQEKLNPFMLKVGIRANNFNDAMEMISATEYILENSRYPVVGAVFGEERWARLALHRAGSNVSFVVARKLKNELGGDDKQFTFSHFKQLTKIA